VIDVSGTWAEPVIDAAANADYQVTNDQAVVEGDASSGARRPSSPATTTCGSPAHTVAASRSSIRPAEASHRGPAF